MHQEIGEKKVPEVVRLENRIEFVLGDFHTARCNTYEVTRKFGDMDIQIRKEVFKYLRC